MHIRNQEAFMMCVSWDGIDRKAMRGYLLHLHTDVLHFSFFLTFNSIRQVRMRMSAAGQNIYQGGFIEEVLFDEGMEGCEIVY